MLIRLSQTTTTGSILSIYLERSWRLTYLSEATCRSRARCWSSNACFQTKRRARHILNAHDGVTASSVPTAERPVSPIVTPPALVFFVAGSVGVKLVSPPAPSWSARTLHSRSGSRQLTLLSAKRRVCRLSSSSGNSDCRATRPPSRFSTNSGLHGSPRPGPDRRQARRSRRGR